MLKAFSLLKYSAVKINTLLLIHRKHYLMKQNSVYQHPKNKTNTKPFYFLALLALM